GGGRGGWGGGGNPVHAGEVLVVAAVVPPARAGEVERAAIVDDQRGRGRDTGARGAGRRLETATGHVDARHETRGQDDLRHGRRRQREHHRQDQTCPEPPAHASHLAAILPEPRREVKPPPSARVADAILPRAERDIAMDPSATDPSPASPDGVSPPRIVVVLETAVPPAVHDACADVAAGLADRLRMSVTLASIPACCLEA